MLDEMLIYFNYIHIYTVGAGQIGRKKKHTYTLPLIIISIFFSLNLFYMCSDNVYIIKVL